MSWLSLLWWFMALILLVDGLRMRRALGGLLVAEPRGGEVDPAFATWALPGVEVPPVQQAALAELARKKELLVVDVVPADLPAIRALALATITDLASYRHNPAAHGRTATAAFLVSPDVPDLEALAAPQDTADMVSTMIGLKERAPTKTDFIVAPAVSAPALSARDRLAQLETAAGVVAVFVIAFKLITLGLFALGLAFPGTRVAALVCIALFHLQPWMATTGTPMQPRDLVAITLLRTPMELWEWLRIGIAAVRPRDTRALREARERYRGKLDGAPERYFEPRVQQCPLCGDTALSEALRTRDLLQNKPGTFVLERCGGCSLVFQNPRLTIDGLDFYYADFYEGLGARTMEVLFRSTRKAYAERSTIANGHVEPSDWLDVGCGMGHFAEAARTHWPNTRFDGLDLSSHIHAAVRRGWLRRGIEGLFPHEAPKLAGAYDVVSMFHYLEHTREPAAELQAAHTALRDGGWLLIEVPNPDSELGRRLGRYWVPWLQPQHLNLLPPALLGEQLKKHGFEPVVWHHGEAHQEIDFLFATALFINDVAPNPDWPWSTRPSMFGLLWRRVVAGFVGPIAMVGHLVDLALAPVWRKRGWSNTYRVLARKI